MPDPPADGPRPPDQHYFTGTPAVASSPVTFPLVLPDLTLSLTADRGVFSGERVDAGTKLLLLEAPPVADVAGDVLDLGCGYGPMAVTLARRAPGVTVWAVEVNERALALCAQNAERAGVADRVHVALPDDVPAEVRFATIWSNPPIRIGKQALHDLLRRWLARLRPDGEAVLVVQRHLGADSLVRWLQEEGHPTRRITSRSGYRVLGVGARSPVPEEDL